MSAFGANPEFRGGSKAELFEAALSQPMNLGATFWDQAKGGVLESFGLGTAIRDVAIPEGNVAPEVRDRENVVAPMLNPLAQAYIYGRKAVQALNPAQPSLSKDAYEASAWFRQDIPWDEGMTEDRAASLASWYDAKKVREYYAEKRPITAFLGNLAGQAVDPINYIPIAGPSVRAANVARFGTVKGIAATSALDAAGNTALFGLATRETRASFGDDVSWQRMVSEIATAALIGGAFGSIAGALGRRADAKLDAAKKDAEQRLATLKTTQEARIALNEAIDGLVTTGDVRLSPNATEPLARVAAELTTIKRNDDLVPESFYNQPHQTIDDFYRVAPLHQSSLDDVGSAIGRDLGIEYRTKGIKDRATAEAKIARKGYKGPQNITDVVRSGFVVDTQAKADEVVARLAEMFDVLDEGWVRTNAGYIDRKVLVRFPDGTVGEVQLWEPNLLKARKAGGHALYKKARALPFDSPEAVALRAEMEQLYSAATAAAPGDWSSIGGVSSPKLLKRARQSSSDMTPAVSQTSHGSAATHSEFGSSIAQASDLPSTAGRASQFTNSIVSSPSIDTTGPRPEGLPEGRSEAESRVARNETPRDIAEQFGVDLATGDFVEMTDIDQMRAMGRLTAEDEAALTAASEDFETAEAYGNTMKAALFCAT